MDRTGRLGRCHCAKASRPAVSEHERPARIAAMVEELMILGLTRETAEAQVLAALGDVLNVIEVPTEELPSVRSPR